MAERKRVAPVEVKHTDPYHIRYRPTQLQEIVGHHAVVASLEDMLTGCSRPHTFLFTGQAGMGKTTLARILAEKFQCSPTNIVEVDAAVTNGVEDMRALVDTMRFTGFGSKPNKMFIIDECHILSKQAWGALLKGCEEPPEHVFFCFCTSEDGKVPDTINSRAQTYHLKPVRMDDLMDLLEYVCEEEKISTDTPTLSMIARAANGSPRTALTLLQKTAHCKSKEDVADLLEEPLENTEVIELCRALVAGKLDWKTVQSTIKSLNESATAEGTRIVMVNYLSSCLLGAKNTKEVPRLLDMLKAFSNPCNPTDKWAGILLSLGEFIFPS